MVQGRWLRYVRLWLPPALAAALILTAAACSGPPAETSQGQAGGGGSSAPSAQPGEASADPGPAETAPSRPPSGELPTIRLATITPKGPSGFVQMAKHKGFFEEEGVQVEYMFIESATNIAKAVIAGEADVADINPGLFLDAIATGNTNFKLIGAALPGLSYYIYAKNDITGPKDMEGRIAGVAAPRSFLDEMITLWMIKGGADPSKAVRVASGGSAASFQALLVGKIDANAAGPEYLEIADENPDIHMVTELGKILPEYINFALVATNEMREERRDDLKAFMKGYARGLRYAIENREETIQLSAQILNLSPDEPGLAQTYDVLVDGRLLSPDLSITEEQVDYMAETRVIMGGTPEKLSVDQIWDPSVQREIAPELGPFNWP